MTPDHAVSLWIAQNEMLWSRIKTASVVEAGAVVGAYNFWTSNREQPFWASAILCAGSLLLCCVILLMQRDSDYVRLFSTVASIPRPAGRPGLLIGALAILVLIGFNVVFMFLVNLAN